MDSGEEREGERRWGIHVLVDLRDFRRAHPAGISAHPESAHKCSRPRTEAYKVARLKLCNAPAHIYQVLSITGVLVILVPMYESMETP